MSSFILREFAGIWFSTEHGSKLFVCYLDTKQAFDRIQHESLIYKLYVIGVDSTTLLAFSELYSNLKRCVKNYQFTSDWFRIGQGTRQGGKCSPLLYLLFNDGLIRQLQDSNFGICMYNHSIVSPTVAYDMTLVLYSCAGRNGILEICYNYSRKWRFEFNASKCYLNPREWTLGAKSIDMSLSYEHLGIKTDNF